MAGSSKRKTTVSLLIAAGVTLAVALSLAARRDADPPAPRQSPAPAPLATPAPQLPSTPEPAPLPEPKPRPAPQVDVVFVLDTTGSMSGLIEGAKQKIWSIANKIISGQPRPDVRIGLIGYRDLGDDYVTRQHALSEDIDDVYARLQRFSAGGGGDTPEHVNRALAQAIREMQWREGQGVLRQIFLVGDAPPHEGREGLTSAALARQAAQAGIVINAVRCGTMAQTQVAWRKIAGAAGGLYASISQDGGMVAMATPMDRRLAELNRELSGTLLPTGRREAQRAARRRAVSNAAMGRVSQAESAKYRAKSGRLDSADLLTVLARGKKLDDLSDAELPPALASLPAAERQARVVAVEKKRAQLKEEIGKLARDRDSYIRSHRPKKAAAFDDTVAGALKVQGGRAGIAY